jgi:lipid A disaccharide synthetase
MSKQIDIHELMSQLKGRILFNYALASRKEEFQFALPIFDQINKCIKEIENKMDVIIALNNQDFTNETLAFYNKVSSDLDQLEELII